MASAGASRQRSTTTSRALVPADIKPIRSDLSRFFQGVLRNRGQSILSQPGGITGSIFQNLYGDDPSTDFLGARRAMEGVLGGNISPFLTRIQGQLMPAALQRIGTGAAALRSAAGPLGLRFSTNLLGQQRALAGQVMNQLGQDTISAAVPMFRTRGEAAMDMYRQVAGLREGDLARLLPLMVSYATQFAPLGSFGQSSGGSWNLGVG